MKKVKVIRTFESDKQTLGACIVTSNENGVEFICRTLELPDKQNANNVSRILAGKYKCRYTQSHSLKDKEGKPLKCYEIVAVPGRAGVRIHSANFFSQLRGCISLGASHKDINADAHLDLIHSGKTIQEFEKLMNYQDFELEIIDLTK
jgi:hypothetical protein